MVPPRLRVEGWGSVCALFQGERSWIFKRIHEHQKGQEPLEVISVLGGKLDKERTCSSKIVFLLDTHSHAHITPLLLPDLLIWVFLHCPAVAPMLGAEEEAHKPYPLGRTVTSLALWLMSWAMWLGSGMNTPGQTETSMSPSSGKTSSQVRRLCGVWELKARKVASPGSGRSEGERVCWELTSAHF